MNMMLKMALGTCLLGFVNLAGMEVKKPDAKKADALAAPKDLSARRRSADKFIKVMGSLKTSCNDVIRLHTEVIGKYQSVLEDTDGKLGTFAKLKEPNRTEVIGFKEELLKELDALEPQDEFVCVVRALHESIFKAGHVERLVVQDKNKSLVVDPLTSKMILPSHLRVILWCDEHFIIQEFRAMATTLETGKRLSIAVDGKGAQESHESLIRERLVACELLLVDSSDGKVKHSKFADDVEELLGNVEACVKDASLRGHVVEQLCKCTDDLARTYLVPVL